MLEMQPGKALNAWFPDCDIYATGSTDQFEYIPIYLQSSVEDQFLFNADHYESSEYSSSSSLSSESSGQHTEQDYHQDVMISKDDISSIHSSTKHESRLSDVVYQILKPWTASLLGLVNMAAAPAEELLLSQSDLGQNPADDNNDTEQTSRTPPSSTTPSAQRVRNVPSTSTRRAACTHVKMERLYARFMCQICSYTDMNWVYCCTQDHPDALECIYDARQDLDQCSAWDPKWHNPLPADDNLDRDLPDLLPNADLSLWIQKAVAAGHYTPHQVSQLVAQKQKVVETALTATHKFQMNDQWADEVKASTPSKATTLLPSIKSLQGPPSLVTEIGMVSGTMTAETTAVTAEPSETDTHPSSQVISAAKALPRLFPMCTYQVCGQCRPTYRDRAWGNFEEAYHFDGAPTLQQLEPRPYRKPFASLSLMQTIGQTRPARKIREPSSVFIPGDRMIGLDALDSASRDVADAQKSQNCVPFGLEDWFHGGHEPGSDGNNTKMSSLFDSTACTSSIYEQTYMSGDSSDDGSDEINDHAMLVQHEKERESIDIEREAEELLQLATEMLSSQAARPGAHKRNDELMRLNDDYDEQNDSFVLGEAESDDSDCETDTAGRSSILT